MAMTTEERKESMKKAQRKLVKKYERRGLFPATFILTDERRAEFRLIEAQDKLKFNKEL